jgi:ATP-dependent Clp protease ATP-binding subunit ClpA
VIVADQLGELADHLIGHFVDQARRSGASWTGIGQSMGVSKQAAQKRFTDTGMDRYTDRAKVVVLKAQNGARDLGHDQVGSEHLMVGLLAEWEGLAGLALEAMGVSKQDVERGLASIMPARGKPIRYHVPFSPGMKRIRELTMAESVRLGHNYVGTEHILLGLLCSPEEAGAQLLSGLGVTHAGAEESVMNKLRELSQNQ